MSDKSEVTGPELEQMAKMNIPDKLLDQTINDKTMREFIRCLVLLQIGTSISGQTQSFGHAFGMRNNKTKTIEYIEVDVVVRKGQ